MTYAPIPLWCSIKGQGRPDIVILNEEAKKAYLVDVGGSEENCKAARERKVEKYIHWHEELS